jgi:uncharacterized membrane protein
MMRTRGQLMRRLDTGRIEAALAAAEKKSSGELRVSVAPLFWGSVRKEAEAAFDRLQMAHTKERNGILFFVVPSRHEFVILGDEGIHAKVGQPFWDELARILTEHFAQDRYTEGLIAAIDRAGERLAEHFPRQAGDVNELPDTVDFHPGRGPP